MRFRGVEWPLFVAAFFTRFVPTKAAEVFMTTASLLLADQARDVSDLLFG
jgi:hypothetical protein